MPSNYITSILKEDRIFYPPKDFSKKAYIKNMQEYEKLYKQSIKNPEAFWAEKASQLHWFKKWKTILRNNKGFFKWFEHGKLNVAYNCLDRNIKKNKDKIALIWEPEFGKNKTYTYEQLLKEVCKFANLLKKVGI